MQSRFLLALVALLVGGGIGLGARKLLSADHAQTSIPPQRSAPASIPTPAQSTPSERNADKIQPPTFEEFSKAKVSQRRILMVDYLRAATLEDIKALHTPEWLKLPGIWDSLDLIYLRAVELDAPGFVKWVKTSEATSKFRRHFLNRTLTAWMKTDPRAALANTHKSDTWQHNQLEHQLATEPDRDLAIELLREHFPKSYILRDFEAKHIEELAVTDAAGAMELALKVQSDGGGSAALQKILNNWDASDPTSALAWLRDQKDVGDFTKLASGIIKEIAHKNPQAAMAESAKLPANADRAKLQGEITSLRAKTDLEGTLNDVVAVKDPQQRNHLFTHIAGKIAKDTPERLLQLMVAHGIPTTPQTIGSYNLQMDGYSYGASGSTEILDDVKKAALKLGLENPQRAIAYLGTLGEHPTSKQVAQNWVKKSPTEAATYAVDLPTGSFGKALRQEVFTNWVQDSPQEAVAFLKNEVDLTSEPDLALAVALRWADSDTDAAGDWADTFTDQNLREKILLKLADKMAKEGAR